MRDDDRAAEIAAENHAPDIVVHPADEMGEQMRALYAALVKAQAMMTGLAKDDRNDFARYDYTSAESLIAACKTALNSNGLLLISEEAQIDYAPTPPVQKHLRRLAHVDGGCLCMTQDWPIVEGKGKPLDKATGTSDTTALGYFLRNLLLVPRGKDVDSMDARDDSEYNPAAIQAPRRASGRSDASGRSEKPSKRPAPKADKDRVTALMGDLEAAMAGQRPKWIDQPITWGKPSKDDWGVKYSDALPGSGDEVDGKNRVASWMHSIDGFLTEKHEKAGGDPGDLATLSPNHLAIKVVLAVRSWEEAKQVADKLDGGE